MLSSLTHRNFFEAIKNMRAIDLFSGCGGLSLGFQQAGIQIIAAFDNWMPAIKVYQDNFSHPIHCLDLSSEDSAAHLKKESPDMIIGGPPCQDFSSAGKRDENLGRADLTISFAKIISSIRPQYFVMENVERITKSRALSKSLKIYQQSGYGLTTKVLNASYCGVPQSRKRFFIIGCLNTPDGFLDSYLETGQSKEPMTLNEYLGKSLGINYYYRHPRSYKRRGIFSIHEPSPTIRGVNRPVPKGYVEHHGDPCKMHSGIRALTTVERSYIQTFPKAFRFTGTKTDLEQMIGNAVPVNLARFVAERIMQHISDTQMIKSASERNLLIRPPTAFVDGIHR
jgi:DNA (cytosine-5)-methyltransferase 1